MRIKISAEGRSASALAWQPGQAEGHRAHFKLATLIDDAGQPICSTRCDLKRQRDGTIKQRRKIVFPTAPRDALAVAVRLDTLTDNQSITILL